MSEALDRETQAVIREIVKQESLRRHRLYASLRTDIDDGTPHELKAELLWQKLHEWAHDPLVFIQDCCWAHDAKGRFGAGAVPKGIIAPPGFVPFLPYKKQKELIAMWADFQKSDTEEAAVIEKSRQVFATGLLAGWLPLHSWLFQEGGKTGITSYDKEMIDRGGKGQRTEETLFGSLRSYLDALVTCIPELLFNKRYNRKGRRDGDLVLCGLKDSQDISMKITRPQWWVYGQRMFKEAEGNFIVGDTPGDSLFRGLKLRNAILDEFAQFNHRQDGVCKASWASCQAAAKNRIAPFTLPEKGGTASFTYQLCHNQEFAKVARQISFHWSEVTPYMAGGAWVCRSCRHENPHPPNEPPGRVGIDKRCGRCGIEQRVVFKDMTSPWFKKMTALALGDRTTIAREYQLDWLASQGDVLFSSIDGTTLVRPHPERVDQIVPGFVTLEGLDPGQTMKNAGAWICARLNPARRRISIVGYWMSINPHPEYWVPFLKHWSAERTRRTPVIYGKFAGRGNFGEIFDYPDEAYKVMDLVSRYPLGEIRGDKFGSHMAGGHSMYMGLADYRIFVGWNYTKDREELVKRGVEWSVRLSIDDKIAEIEPPSPLGGAFPSVDKVFLAAKPKQTEGEARRTLDVSKKEPAHVHNGADAWFYLVSQLTQVHAVAVAGGGFIEDRHDALIDGSIDDFEF